MIPLEFLLPHFLPVLVDFFIVLVVTNISSRLCCDMSEVIFTILSSVKINSSCAFGCCCLYTLYKIEVIIQYCANKSESPSQSVNVCHNFVTLVHNWKLQTMISWAQWKMMGILTSYLSIYLISMKSHNHQKFWPQRICLFWKISHLPHDVPPTNKWYFLSNFAHAWYPNAKGLNIAPFLLWSKRCSPEIPELAIV